VGSRHDRPGLRRLAARDAGDHRGVVTHSPGARLESEAGAARAAVAGASRGALRRAALEVRRPDRVPAGAERHRAGRRPPDRRSYAPAATGALRLLSGPAAVGHAGTGRSLAPQVRVAVAG